MTRLDHISGVSCQKGPTRHAFAWQIGTFWQDTLDIRLTVLTPGLHIDDNPPTSKREEPDKDEERWHQMFDWHIISHACHEVTLKSLVGFMGK